MWYIFAKEELVGRLLSLITCIGDGKRSVINVILLKEFRKQKTKNNNNNNKKNAVKPIVNRRKKKMKSMNHLSGNKQ